MRPATVYGACKTNISALSNSQLIAAILYLSAKNPNDPLLQNPQKLFQLAMTIDGSHPSLARGEREINCRVVRPSEAKVHIDRGVAGRDRSRPDKIREPQRHLETVSVDVSRPDHFECHDAG